MFFGDCWSFAVFKVILGFDRISLYTNWRWNYKKECVIQGQGINVGIGIGQ